ncbi:MAG: lysophospholipid acyltransferase family protein [Opitutales bacterium]
MKRKNKLFDLSELMKTPFSKFLYKIFSRPLEHFLGINFYNDAYEYVKENQEKGNFFNTALLAVGASVEVSEEDLNKIPKTGPVIIVANHPHGAVDGIAMGSLLLRAREDTKLMANDMLAKMELIRPYIIKVNPFGGKDAVRENIMAIKDTFSFLKAGGCLATFPSGTVSHLQLKKMQITDPAWNENIASIAMKTKATVLPMYIEGVNSTFFQLMGLIHPVLRTMLLLRELKKTPKRGAVKIRIGTPIPPRKIACFETAKELTAWFRLSTYILKDRPQKRDENSSKFGASTLVGNLTKKILPKKDSAQSKIIDAIPPEEIEAEINALPEECTLIKGDKITVLYAHSWQLKRTMFEIGRLREITFRAVGEGSGKSFDIDEYDSYYLHLFMWDKVERRIVGAYRVGRTDKIISSIGIQGLYTSELFDIKKELLDKISPALEMGRAFITMEYQKKRSTLALLWRGIGEYVARNPKYTTIIGPVSINPDYNAVSKDLIIQFLTEHKSSKELSRYVKAKKPHKIKLNSTDKDALLNSTTDVEFISALISEIEVDNKGIPTLLKYYLKLNGELLCFNRDPSFGNCIDGLIMINLLNTEQALLKAYMGDMQSKSYLEYHKERLEKANQEKPKEA